MALHQVIGAGGMADTRDPEARDDEDPRKSISAAPSFEEYLKQRDGGGGAAPTAAPATAAAPAGRANLVGTLGTLEGPGQVWGADGIAVGKEEDNLKVSRPPARLSLCYPALLSESDPVDCR